MSKNTIHNILENLDGYLISIKRNTENSMYELEVGFRKNWVFKSTKDIECDTTLESDNGTLVTISGKHSDIIIDDLIDFVNKIIQTNRKITEMQEKFEEEVKKRKEEFAEELLKFEEEIERFKDGSFEDDNESEEEDIKETKQKKQSTKTTNKDLVEEVDEKLAQKIN